MRQPVYLVIRSDNAAQGDGFETALRTSYNALNIRNSDNPDQGETLAAMIPNRDGTVRFTGTTRVDLSTLHGLLNAPWLSIEDEPPF